LLFKKEPKFENTMLGLTKKYKESVIETNRFSSFFSDRVKYNSKPNNKNFPNEKKSKASQSAIHSKYGYCIRTGKEIPFNTKQPMIDEAYKSWAKFENKDYPEKFCHF